MSIVINREIQSSDASVLTWGFGPVDAPYIPPGATFKLEIDYLLPNLTHLSFDLAVDYVLGNVDWYYTKDISSALPVNHRIGYTLRRSYNGDIITVCYGVLIVKTGVPI